MAKKKSVKLLTKELVTAALDDLGWVIEEKKNLEKIIKEKKEQIRTFLESNELTDFTGNVYFVELQEKSDRKETSILLEEVSNLCDLAGLLIEDVLDKEYCLIKDRNYFLKLDESGKPFLESFWKTRESLMVIKEVHK